MFSLMVAAVAAMPGQSCSPYYGGYPPVRSSYMAPCYPVFLGCAEYEDPTEKRFKEIEKKLKALDDRMGKAEASGKKLEKDLKALRATTLKQLKELEKKNEERLKALEQKQDERFKGFETKQDERFKTMEQKQEERMKALEQRHADQLKALEARTDDRLRNQEQRTDDRLKAQGDRTDDRLRHQEQRTDDRFKVLEGRWEDRFRGQDEKTRSIELRLLEERVLQGLKKLEDRIGEMERLKGMESKIEDRIRQAVDPLTRELRQIEEKLRGLEKAVDAPKKTGEQEALMRLLDQRLDALELRVKGKVDVLEERLKGVDDKAKDSKHAIERLIDQLRQRKLEVDKQNVQTLEERFRRIENGIQDAMKLEERIRKLEAQDKVPPMMPLQDVKVVHASRSAQPAPAIKVPAHRAVIVLQLPADAELYIDGQLKPAGGQTTRYIQTPDLDADAGYFYLIRVEVVRNGKLVSETRRVSFRAGQEVRVSFDHFGPAMLPLHTASAR